MVQVYEYINGEFIPTFVWKKVKDLNVGDCFEQMGKMYQVIEKQIIDGMQVVRCKSF